jgi:hypothetical protein
MQRTGPWNHRQIIFLAQRIWGTWLQPRQPTPPSGGSERVLAVEDDQPVGNTVVEMLTEPGCEVLKASDADSALAIVRSARKPLLRKSWRLAVRLCRHGLPRTESQ